MAFGAVDDDVILKSGDNGGSSVATSHPPPLPPLAATALPSLLPQPSTPPFMPFLGRPPTCWMLLASNWSPVDSFHSVWEPKRSARAKAGMGLLFGLGFGRGTWGEEEEIGESLNQITPTSNQIVGIEGDCGCVQLRRWRRWSREWGGCSGGGDRTCEVGMRVLAGAGDRTGGRWGMI